MDLYKIIHYIFVFINDNHKKALKNAKRRYNETNDKNILISTTVKRSISKWIYYYFHNEDCIEVLKSYFDSISIYDDIYMNCELSQNLINEFDTLDDETKLYRLRGRLITFISLKYKPILQDYLIYDFAEEDNSN